jgi:hypothetical protein
VQQALDAEALLRQSRADVAELERRLATAEQAAHHHQAQWLGSEAARRAEAQQARQRLQAWADECRRILAGWQAEREQYGALRLADAQLMQVATDRLQALGSRWLGRRLLRRAARDTLTRPI